MCAKAGDFYALNNHGFSLNKVEGEIYLESDLKVHI